VHLVTDAVATLFSTIERPGVVELPSLAQQIVAEIKVGGMLIERKSALGRRFEA
jgi:hypothetical protein